MKSIDEIIKKNIKHFLNEEIIYTLPRLERRKYRNKPEDEVDWVRIGELIKKEWNNDLMKNIPIKIYCELNREKIKELEKYKEDHDISQYILIIDEIRNNFNEISNDLCRFINEDGKRESINIKYSENVKLYDEFKGTVCQDVLLGADVDINQYHEEFMNKLNIINGKVALIHSSSDKITNGIICSNSGTHNIYTPQSDYGYTYFWASGEIGSDNSGGDIDYICEVDINDIYDYSSNMEYLSQKEALAKYKFIAYYWKKENVIVAKTKGGAEISYILYNGKKYNSNWEEI